MNRGSSTKEQPGERRQESKGLVLREQRSDCDWKLETVVKMK
jgi:hypothetical protein